MSTQLKPMGDHGSDPFQSQDPQPGEDTSARAIELARFVDRLPPGKHIITLEKPDVKAAEWKVEVVEVQHNRTMVLQKKLHGKV